MSLFLSSIVKVVGVIINNTETANKNDNKVLGGLDGIGGLANSSLFYGYKMSLFSSWRVF